MIISTLNQSGQSLYDNLPSGKSLSDGLSKITQHSPISKSSTLTNPNVIEKQPIHRAASTTSTVTLAGILIKEPYKIIEALQVLKANNPKPMHQLQIRYSFSALLSLFTMSTIMHVW